RIFFISISIFRNCFIVIVCSNVEFIILINFFFSIHSDFFHFIDFVQILPFFRKKIRKRSFFG
ncbi:unnamed protein product, partial [Brassica oleracea]